MFSDLSIIIVNWNLKEDTIECIESLLKAGALLNQIILVDNGSTDGSIPAINNHFTNSVHIIDAENNLGFAQGNNLGIEYALRQNSKWILLINNDTLVAPNFIEELHQATITSPEFSIITPLILYYDKPSKIWYLGDHLIGNTLLTINYYKNRDVNQKIPSVVPIDFANGCAMMINRKVLEQIGLLDAALFMYAEDVDFCWRARLAGFKFACITTARIWHKISKSSESDRSSARYLRIRNQIYFYRRYSKGYQLFIILIYTLIRTIRISISDLLLWQLDLILPLVRGWWDGWFVTANIGRGK